VQTVTEFVDRDVRPVVRELEHANEYPEKLIGQMKAMGIFGLAIPDPYGGAPVSTPCYVEVTAELARGWMTLAGAMGGHTVVSKLLLNFGTSEQKQRYLPRMATGEIRAAFSLSEPELGSDVQAIKTSAKSTGDGFYEINGQKMWVTSAPVADFFTVFARAGDEKKLTIFLVEKHFKGLAIGKAIAKMGVWALPTSELAFDDCFVPDSHRLSHAEGDGEGHLRKLLAEIRIVTGALALGGARGALEEAIRYAGERQQFGKPINRYQAIQLKLAEMATDLEAARRLVHYAAWLKDNDKPHHKEAAMAKLFASEAAAGICDKAARVLASYGYSMEYAVQRHLRDIRFTLIGGGTSEILKLVIAKELSA